MRYSMASAATLLCILLTSCSDTGERNPAAGSETNADTTAMLGRATKAFAGQNIASTLPPFSVAPAKLNGSASQLEWGSQITAPRVVQAPVGSGDGLIILGNASSFDVTIAGADGHHLYVECALAPNPRRDVRFESVVSAAGPSVGTMTFDQSSNRYFAVTPVVQPSQDRPTAHFVISGPSPDAAANIALRSCTILPFKAG